MSLVSKDNNIFRDIGVSSSAAIAISLFKLIAYSIDYSESWYV